MDRKMFVFCLCLITILPEIFCSESLKTKSEHEIRHHGSQVLPPAIAKDIMEIFQQKEATAAKKEETPSNRQKRQFFPSYGFPGAQFNVNPFNSPLYQPIPIPIVFIINLCQRPQGSDGAPNTSLDDRFLFPDDSRLAGNFIPGGQNLIPLFPTQRPQQQRPQTPNQRPMYPAAERPRPNPPTINTIDDISDYEDYGDSLTGISFQIPTTMRPPVRPPPPLQHNSNQNNGGQQMQGDGYRPSASNVNIQSARNPPPQIGDRSSNTLTPSASLKMDTNCNLAVVRCCAAGVKNRDRCFQQFGCTNRYWDVHPCDNPNYALIKDQLGALSGANQRS